MKKSKLLKIILKKIVYLQKLSFSQHSVLLSNAEAFDGYFFFLTISTVLKLGIKHQNI